MSDESSLLPSGGRASGSGAGGAAFGLNLIGSGCTAALAVLTFLRLTLTTSLSLPTRCGYLVVYAVIAALWVWIAVKCRAGRQWAKITGTVFFAAWNLPATATAIGAASMTLDAWQTGAAVITGVIWLVGLASVIVLWTARPRSEPSLPILQEAAVLPSPPR